MVGVVDLVSNHQLLSLEGPGAGLEGARGRHDGNEGV